MADRTHMDADLVGAPAGQPALNESSDGPERFIDLIAGESLATAALNYRHLLAVGRAAADAPTNVAFGWRRDAPNHCLVGAVDRMRCELRSESAMGDIV